MKASAWLFAGGAVVVLAALAGCARPESDDRVIEIEVGRYHYTPGSDAPLNLTLGETVVLRITSADVTHGFAIEGLGVQVEVPAKSTIEVRITPTRAGDFTIYCTVFCGSGHPQHKGTLHVA